MSTAKKSPATRFLNEINRLHRAVKVTWPFKVLFPNTRRKEIINLQKAITNKNGKLFKNAEPQMKIGAVSVNGAIFKMKKINPYNMKPFKVMKIVKSPGGVKEFEFQRNASAKGLAPKVYNLVKGANIPARVANAFFLQQAGRGVNRVKINAFTMNNLQQSNDNKVSNFHTYMKKASPANRRVALGELKNMINKLGNEGISHGDLHAGNVYVVISPGELPRFLIIDFGRSWKVHRMNTRRTVGTANRARRTAAGSYQDPDFGSLLVRQGNATPHILNKRKFEEFMNAYRV